MYILKYEFVCFNIVVKLVKFRWINLAQRYNIFDGDDEEDHNKALDMLMSSMSTIV